MFETGSDRTPGSEPEPQKQPSQSPRPQAPASPERPPEEATPPASTAFEDALREHDTILPIPNVGQRLHATILQIGDETTFVDYRGRSEAAIETRHLRGPDGALTVQVGDRIEAYVIANEETVVLAPAYTPSADEGLQSLRDAHRNAVPVTGKVTGVNSGGLEVSLGSHRAFCPASQIELNYVADPSVYLGQSFEFRLLEFGDMGRRIVVSRRALLMQRREEEAAKLRESLKAGDERDGTVVRMEAFGAFVDLGGLDGMVHVSEISHDRVSHPSEALKIGDAVRVKVLEIGKDPKGRDRISLSIKAATEDPWAGVTAQMKDGDLLDGQVVRLADFGAFVRLFPGIEGLVHVSELRPEKTMHPREVVKEGQDVRVQVLSVEPQRRRISLTMRLDEAGERPAGERAAGGAGEAAVLRAGEATEGVVRAHKPYGVFIDLPAFGPRTSGLLPLEESGVGRGELTRRYPAGQKLEVNILQIDEKGRIRLSLPGRTADAGAEYGAGARAGARGGGRTGAGAGAGGRGGAGAGGRGAGFRGTAPGATAGLAGPQPSRGVPSAFADALRKALEEKQKPSS